MRIDVTAVLAGLLLAAGCGSQSDGAPACASDAGASDASIASGSDASVPASDAGGDDTAAPAQVQRVFISSKDYPSDFMKTETASLVDVGARMCAELATAAGLGGGPWRAWLSSSTVNARDGVTGTGPWYDVKGEVVFADRFELLGGARGPTYTETGGTLPTVVNGQAQTYSMFTAPR